MYLCTVGTGPFLGEVFRRSSSNSRSYILFEGRLFSPPFFMQPARICSGPRGFVIRAESNYANHNTLLALTNTVEEIHSSLGELHFCVQTPNCTMAQEFFNGVLPFLRQGTKDREGAKRSYVGSRTSRQVLSAPPRAFKTQRD